MTRKKFYRSLVTELKFCVSIWSGSESLVMQRPRSPDFKLSLRRLRDYDLKLYDLAPTINLTNRRQIMSVQLTLFDLEDYNVPPMAEIIPVGSRVAMAKEKVEYQQLELNLFPKSPDRKKRMLTKVAA